MLECPRINSFAPSLLTLTPLVIPLRFSHVSASAQGELIGGSNVAWPTQNSWSPPFSFILFSPCQIMSWDLTLARTISLFAHNLNLTLASPFSSIFKSSSDINPLFTIHHLHPLLLPCSRSFLLGFHAPFLHPDSCSQPSRFIPHPSEYSQSPFGGPWGYMICIIPLSLSCLISWNPHPYPLLITSTSLLMPHISGSPVTGPLHNCSLCVDWSPGHPHGQLLFFL